MKQCVHNGQRRMPFFHILGRRPVRPSHSSVCVMTVTSRRGIWNNFWFRQQQQQQPQQQEENLGEPRGERQCRRAVLLHKYDTDLLQ